MMTLIETHSRVGVAATLLLGVLAGGHAGAQQTREGEDRCGRLSDVTMPDASIVSSTVVNAGTFSPPPVPYAPDLAQRATLLPAFCRIQAIAKPTADSNIGIEVWLPMREWNGRFLGTGNGGGAASIAYAMGMMEGLRRGFAVANTDMGTAPDPNTAMGHPERWTDFGHRATHEMTRVSKRLVQTFYDRSSFRSYFAGCSTGGQQALSEAQRYPDDYDGILAGAPGHNRTHIHTMFLWNFNALNATPESNLSASQWSSISSGVIKSCAGKDGGAPGDRFLTDPRRCKFDVDALATCDSRAASGQCFSPRQIDAVRRLYAGPVNPRTGERIFAPLTYGSEDQPLGPAMQADRVDWPAQQFYPFKWALGNTFDPLKFDFDHDLDRVDAVLASQLNATSSDLARFQRRGGKLMIYTGLADPAVPFQDAIGYYERVVETRGGLEQAQAFARLFLVPGMGHCFGGPGATDFGQPFSSVVPAEAQADALMTLVDWVEHGRAPDRFLASRYASATSPPVARRPVCVYPKLPQYSTGDPDRETSYRCIESARGAPAVPAARYAK